MEEPTVFNALTVYRERGSYLRRLEQFDKSKAAYDEAYKSDPNNVALLIGRSKVCADAMETEQSYADAESALKLDPTSMPARNVQANALYTMSNFERSVVMNYRGSRCRRQPPYFTDGIIQGLETIQDCVGENAGHVMLDFLPLIAEQEANKKEMQHDVFVSKHVSRIPRARYVKKMTQLEKRRHDILSRVLAMKYLGPLAYDKFFLQELSDDCRIPSANSSGTRKLRKTIKEAWQSLSERQEMLREQRPYYTIKFAEKSESYYLTKYKKDTLEKERTVNTRTADRYIKDIEKNLRNNRLKDLITNAERMQVFLDTKTPHTLPDKNLYIDRLYRIVGDGYLSQHRMSYYLSEPSNRRRIAFLMGLPIGRPRSFDSVMAKYPYKFVDINMTIKKVEENIEMCENSYMRCWLYYEMARLQNKQKKFAMAKLYAKRCQSQAQEIDSAVWWLNGCMVLMAGEMQQGNLNDIRIMIEEALEFTKKVQNPERMRAFLSKCLQMADEAVPPDENKAIKQREREILAVVDSKTKVEARVLFKRISTLPLGRRFEVLPRKVQPCGYYTAERRRRHQLGLTILPGQPRALPPMPKSEIRGYQKFDL